MRGLSFVCYSRGNSEEGNDMAKITHHRNGDASLTLAGTHLLDLAEILDACRQSVQDHEWDEAGYADQLLGTLSEIRDAIRQAYHY